MPFFYRIFFSLFILVFFFLIFIIAFYDWCGYVGTLLHWETKLFMGARYWRALFTCSMKVR